jgi:hypothetical protein
MALPDPDEARSWGGKTIVDRGGATIGACTQVYTDDATGLPEWATARLGNISALVPLVDAVEDDGAVRVAVGRDDVLLAPGVADQRHISQDEEERLYRHYGIPVTRDGAGQLLPASEARRRAVAVSDRQRSADRKLLLGVLVAGAAVAGLAGGVSALTRRRQR